MAEWTKQDVRDLAPEFSAVADPVLDRFIAYAAPWVNPNEFTDADRLKLAGALLTAHFLTVFAPPGVTVDPVTGPVQSRTVGQVSVTYAVATLTADSLNSGLGRSKYGVEFSRLSRLQSLGPRVL